MMMISLNLEDQYREIFMVDILKSNLRKDATGGGQVRAIDCTRSDLVSPPPAAAAGLSTKSKLTSEAACNPFISKSLFIPNSKLCGRGLTQRGRKRKVVPMEERPILVGSKHLEGRYIENVKERRH